MLQFTGLVIENFGPFKGTQTIDLSDPDGVTIIWGNNGRGKTTLLNIIRYALFGEYRDRRGIDVDLRHLVNLEAQKDGIYDFKVVLKMVNDGTSYELTRQYVLRKGVSEPQTNDDYEKKVYLKKNSSILSPDQRDHELKLIMPEEVSRFFLFDGELLEDYEELLMQDTTSGSSIKTSIEQILGLPVLTNGANDASFVRDERRKEKNKIAQSNAQTQKIASQINTLEAEMEEHRSEIERLQGELSKEVSKKLKLEDKARQSERVTNLIKDLENIEGTIAEKEAQVEVLSTQIILITGEAWKGLVNSRVEQILKQIESQIQILEKKDNDSKLAYGFVDDMKKAAENHHCHLCDQDIPSEKLEALLNKIMEQEPGYKGLSEEEKRQLQELRVRKATLEEVKGESKKDVLAVLENQLLNLDVEIGDTKGKKKDLRTELELHGNIDDLTKGTRENAKLLASCYQKIDNYKEGIDEERKKLEDAKTALASLENRLNQLSTDTETKRAKRKVDLCEAICDIFEKGIDAYRDKLKKDVERDATDLFVQISNDKDYTSLRINDNYGLFMVHKDGEIVPLRSAGYEHIVALSLIGALHKNAPLRGPIIMDSPFGRLDPDHKNNITKVLPKMSEQIILLVYTHEIDEQTARDTLGSKLKREYRLQRYSSFNTQIEAQ